MNYVEVKNYDISNGTGVRVSLFVSGCTHHCKNCFNKEAWDFNYGKEFTNEVIDQIISSLNHSYIEGLTILGGEPMELVNQEGILPLIKRVKKELPSKNIWIYTGYSFDDDLIPWSKKYNFTKEILNNVDVIVDGADHLHLLDIAGEGLRVVAGFLLAVIHHSDHLEGAFQVEARVQRVVGHLAEGGQDAGIAGGHDGGAAAVYNQRQHNGDCGDHARAD